MAKRRKRHRKRKRMTIQEKLAAGCPKCGCIHVRQSFVTFANGTEHVRVECDYCGKFRKWGNVEVTADDRPTGMALPPKG